MKIIQRERGFRIVDFPFAIGVIAFPLAVFMGVEFVIHIVHGAPGRESAAILLGALIFGIGGAAFTQRSEFDFDPAERKVTWSERSLFASRCGVILFSQIKFAVVQCSNGGSAKGFRTYYRVALVTEDESTPVTVSYTGGKVSDDQCREVRSRINTMLDVHLPSEDDNDIRELALDGQRLQAQAMVRERYSLNSTKAHELVVRLIAESDGNPKPA